MILSHLRTAVLAAFPGLDAPKKAFFRVVRDVVGRLNLQPVAGSADQTKDLAAVDVCPGVPGVTSDPPPGETPIVAFVGADGVPYVIARAAEGMPGHTPIEVRHDATTAIRLISKAASSGAKVYVGAAPTKAVALAPDLVTYLNTIEMWALSIDLAIAPAVALLTAPQQATYSAAVTARTTAAGNISSIAATKLEAK